MIPNFVFFGPTHSGKTTMATYILVHEDAQANEQFIRFKKEPAVISHQKYNQIKYTWFLDRSSQERKKSVEIHQGKSGTSVFMHPWPVRKEDKIIYNLIDTPGMDSSVKERIRGIFWGDIGIFVAECDDVLESFFKISSEEDTIRDYLNPLNLWSKLGKKRIPRLIIALSKMDKVNFSKEKFENAKSKLVSICNEINIPDVHIIPISIDTKEEKNHNIIDKSFEMKWYNGPTLIEVIDSQLSESQIVEDNKKQLLLTLEGTPLHKKGIGDVISGKILSGKLEVSDNVKIIPIEYNGRIESLYGKIKTLKIQRSETTKEAIEGSIISVSLTDQLINNKRVQIADYTIFGTSILVREDIRTILGNTIKLGVSPQDKRRFHILENLHIIWLGRLIPATVISYKDEINEVCVRLNSDIAAIPKNEKNSLCFTHFIMSIDKSIVRSTIQEIGFIEALQFKLTRSDKNTINLFKYFTQYPPEINENLISFKNNLEPSQNVFDIIQRIKKFQDKKCGETFPILESIEIRLRVDESENHHI